MQRKLMIGLITALLMLGLLSVAAYAQGTSREYTGFQVMNLATCAGCDAHVRVDYYDQNGTLVLSQPLETIAPGGSANVQQKTQGDLREGVYSAVLSSDQPIAAVVGQVESDPQVQGAIYQPPFSNYTGASAGSTKVVMPSIMHNWYGLDTLVRIQNAGDADTTVTVQYYASSFGGSLAGQSNIAAQTVNIKRYAAVTLDQANLAQLLAATSGPYQGRFLGSLVVTSNNNQPLVAVVNETNPTSKLKFTYNGFGNDDAGNELLAPSILSRWYGTITSLSVANPSTTGSVNVTLTYTAGAGSLLADGSNGAGQTETKTFTLGPGESSTRYEGGAGNDLWTKFQRFAGSVRIVASGPVVAKVNQTQVPPQAANPSGAYNAVPVNRLTQRVAAPLIQADFYNYFTSLTCANASTTQAAQVTIQYTSDTLSAVPNRSGSVTHTIPAGGSIIRYEATRGNALADINKPGTVWDNGTTVRFNGSAIITSAGPAIACTVNEVGAHIQNDNMNSYNAVPLQANP